MASAFAEALRYLFGEPSSPPSDKASRPQPIRKQAERHFHGAASEPEYTEPTVRIDKAA